MDSIDSGTDLRMIPPAQVSDLPAPHLSPPRVVVIDGLEISWDPRVLRPRRWTVEQSHWLASYADHCPPGPILEICCGAGHIGLVAAKASGRDLVQVDRDPVAAAYARHNAARAGVVTDVRVGRFEDVLHDTERFPLVLADPPWVPSHRVSRFPEDPPGAIDGGPSGMDAAVACMDAALAALDPVGRCVLQVGDQHQAERLVARCADTHQDRDVQVRDCSPGGFLIAVGAG